MGKEELEARLHLSKILIDIFKDDITKINPKKDDLNEILKRAYNARFKMQAFYLENDKSPVLNRQIKRMDTLIKKIEKLHNKHVTEMR